jgi:hypothetical protein
MPYNNCYTIPDYAIPGYFTCDINKPDLPIPHAPNGPVFDEEYKNNYRGAPGVNIGHKITQKTPDRYDFVTSIVIESEQGEPNKPTYINTPQELIDIYGTKITKDMKYALSFLFYSPSLLVSRSIGLQSYNSSTKDFPLIKVNNYEDFKSIPEDDFLQDATVRFIAQTPGSDGDLLKVSLFTVEELSRNANIYNNFNAQDIIKGMDDMCYCVAIFKDDQSMKPELTKLKEVFVIPFNDLESINIQSKLVYCRLNAYNDFLDGLYDGNDYTYTGNIVYADGDAGRYFYGYDGNLELIDGNIVLRDGNEYNNITYVVKFYDGNIMSLGNGNTQKANIYELEETASELDNVLNYNIDLHIGNNVTLFRKDCVNIVGTPKGVSQAIDFKGVFDAKRSTYVREKSNNTFFIYGTKMLDSEELDCSADYAGLRSKEVLTNGLGISTSKITKPLSITRLKTAPSMEDIDLLYQNGINIVHKYRDVIYCNGEIMHEDNI